MAEGIAPNFEGTKSEGVASFGTQTLVFNSDSTTASPSPLDPADASNANTFAHRNPHFFRYLSIYHRYNRGSSDSITTAPTVRVYGLIPLQEGRQRFDPRTVQLRTGATATFRDLKENDIPADWYPLYDPENGVHAIDFAVTEEQAIAFPTSRIEATSPRRFVDVENAIKVVILVSTAASLPSGADGMIVGRFVSA